MNTESLLKQVVSTALQSLLTKQEFNEHIVSKLRALESQGKLTDIDSIKQVLAWEAEEGTHETAETQD